MRSIAIASHKGGVGKTTLSVNLAHGLAVAGKRVLLVDADPQGGATRYLGVEPDDAHPHLHDVLDRRAGLAEAALPVDGVPNLLLVPADLELARIERELRDTDRLSQAVQALGRTVDVLLFDCPPGWGTLTLNVLSAVREVIAPAELKPLSLMALVDLAGMVADVRRELNPRLRMAGVVPFRVQRTRLSRETLDDLQGAFKGQVLPPVRESARVAESPGFRQPVAVYAPDSIGAQDFAALADAVLLMGTRRHGDKGMAHGKDTPVNRPGDAAGARAGVRGGRDLGAE